MEVGFIQALIDPRVWQVVYFTIFSLGGVLLVGLLAPLLTSSSLLRPLFGGRVSYNGVVLLPQSRSEQLLNELEECRQRKELSLGTVSAYQSFREALVTASGLKIRKDMTEMEALERLLRLKGSDLDANRLREFYRLYEKARFAPEQVEEADLEKVKGLLSELSFHLKEPRLLTMRDVGLP